MRHVGEETVFRLSGILQFNIFLMQGALNPFALGDIADSARHQYAFLGFERAETDLHRKFRAIFAQAVEFKTRTHRPGARLRKEIRAMPDMEVAKTFRQQRLDRLSAQFSALIT